MALQATGDGDDGGGIVAETVILSRDSVYGRTYNVNVIKDNITSFTFPGDDNEVSNQNKIHIMYNVHNVHNIISTI